jgi:hypothetical protein
VYDFKAASQDELSPGPLYELVQNVEARPPQQEVRKHTFVLENKVLVIAITVVKWLVKSCNTFRVSLKDRC